MKLTFELPVKIQEKIGGIPAIGCIFNYFIRRFHYFSQFFQSPNFLPSSVVIFSNTVEGHSERTCSSSPIHITLSSLQYLVNGLSLPNLFTDIMTSV